MDIHKTLSKLAKKHSKEKAKLINPLKKEIAWAKDKLETLQNMLAEITGTVSKSGRPKGATAKPRTRTSSMELHKKANDIAAYIESHGKVEAKEILEKFGKLTPSISAFLKGRTEKKVKFSGPKNKRVYYVA
jgi:hypothetical protein